METRFFLVSQGLLSVTLKFETWKKEGQARDSQDFFKFEKSKIQLFLNFKEEKVSYYEFPQSFPCAQLDFNR